jgi:hypothetical protein|tara:strand:- start:1711 stop:2181 length:471 start_codon:yes stop_codon:yes gene_type:complete
MAYQRLQAGRCLAVIPSDTVDIPNVSAAAASGTTTSATASKLTDTGGDFVNQGIRVGDIVYAGTIAATVTAIDSATVLSTSATITTATAYTIYAQADTPSNGCCIYCGGTGNVSITTMAGDEVILEGIPTGLFIPINGIKRVNSTGTTQSAIIALW